MRVVILGLSVTSSWGNGHATNYRALLRALEHRGHEALFLERDVPWYASNRDLREVPYATAVIVERFEDKPKLLRIAAAIFCERDSQKAILIGKGGQKLKQMGTSARMELEKRFNKKVYLELFVKVKAGWRQSAAFVEELDWRRQLENLASGKIEE